MKTQKNMSKKLSRDNAYNIAILRFQTRTPGFVL